MPSRKAALVVTTIFEPNFLPAFADNFLRHGRAADVQIIVIPDRKTPPSVGRACQQAAREGLRTRCPALDEQDAFLKRLGVPADWIPLDSDNRRNVGYLLALAEGCDFVLSIDDDNFCRDSEDFYSVHAIVGTEMSANVRHGSDGWLNLCDSLTFTTAPTPFPRGFPYSRRREPREIRRETAKARVALNAGLWLDDPDVDAVGRLESRPKALTYHDTPFVLGPNTWSPINTQNTAISRAAMAAYYYVRMGFAIEGLKIDRYGDILSGYFAQKCIRHLGEAVRVGDPICDHRRTPHNLFKDLYHELAGMVLIEELTPWLIELKLSGRTYAEAYACLADELAAAAEKFRGFVFDQGGRDFLTATAGHMRNWLRALRALGIS
jgi:hypothetical protein